MAEKINTWINIEVQNGRIPCRVATPYDIVVHSECAFTFHSPFTSKKGILVNMVTFLGTIEEKCFSSYDRKEAIFLRIVKERNEKISHQDSSFNVEKTLDGKSKSAIATKLAIGVEGGFQTDSDKFEVVTHHSIVLASLKHDGSGIDIHSEIEYHPKKDITTTEISQELDQMVQNSAESIIHHSGLSIQQDLQSWELDSEPIPESKHWKNLPFIDNGVRISPSPRSWKCEKSGDTENLWLNLSDGFIGGGRKHWDGSGGSNGALDHFNETSKKYPLVVKLGTITSDINTADCYSYAEDEDGPVKIPNLIELLAKRGIHAYSMQKTAKSTSELEVEKNATYEFDAITESGSSLIPVSGAGLQGLQNLGNSCYINAIVQTLFSGSIPELCRRYGVPIVNDSLLVHDHQLLLSSSSGKQNVVDDVLIQTTRLGIALTSGAFCPPHDAIPVEPIHPKYRLAPRMFKHAIAKDHVDFRTGQQQDAAHYLAHLLETLDRAERSKRSLMPLTSRLFGYRTISRVVCSADGLIQYNESSPTAPEILLSLPIPKSTFLETCSQIESLTGEQGLKQQDSKRLKCSKEQRECADGKNDDDVVAPTISLESCFDAWAAPNTIERMRWDHLGNSKNGYDGNISDGISRLSFRTFPPYLFVALQRYELGEDWSPKKIEVTIDVPEVLDLSKYRCNGPTAEEQEHLVPSKVDDNQQANEVRKQENAESSHFSTPVVDESSIQQLMSMGFSSNGVRRALLKNGGNVEAALNWIFDHSMDSDFNDPLPYKEQSNSNDTEDVSKVTNLVDTLGCFTYEQVGSALKICDGDAARTADWLFSHMDDLDEAIASNQNSSKAATISPTDPSFSPSEVIDGDGKYMLIGLISHIGKHTGSGHYVCHKLWKNKKWVMFNDEKVAISQKPPIPNAYIYLFRRIDDIGKTIDGF